MRAPSSGMLVSSVVHTSPAATGKAGVSVPVVTTSPAASGGLSGSAASNSTRVGRCEKATSIALAREDARRRPPARPRPQRQDSNHALVGRRGAHLAAFDEADQNNLFGDPDIVGEDAAELPSSPAARLVPRWRGSTTRARRRREDRIRKLTLLFGEEATGFPFGRERVCRGRRPT